MTTQSFIQPHYNTFAPPVKTTLKINLNFSLFHRLRSNTPNTRRAKVETYKRFQYAFFSKHCLTEILHYAPAFLTNLTRLCSALPAIWAIKKSRKSSGPAITILIFKRKYISKQTKMPVYT